MMSNRKHVIMDEFSYLNPNPIESRIRNRMISEGLGWFIGEQYDERFETEVGGTHILVSQSINDEGKLVGGFRLPQTIADLKEMGNKAVDNPPVIIDYEDNAKRYSLEEAEAIPEMSGVVARLKQRIEEHKTYRFKNP